MYAFLLRELSFEWDTCYVAHTVIYSPSISWCKVQHKNNIILALASLCILKKTKQNYVKYNH